MRRRFRVLRLRFFAVFKAAASREIQHIACKFDADFFEFLIAVSFQNFDGFLDLDGVSDGVAQRFIHIRDDRPCDFARLIADIDHNFCKREPFVKGFIERAAADFDVQNDAVRARGEFFAHNAGCDKRAFVDGCRYVPKRVQFFVRGRKFPALTDDAAPDGIHDFKKSSREREVSYPGIDSSLSTVPPV